MYVFVSVLIVLAAVLLIFVVVIQNSKGGGLAAGFSSSNQVMGVRKTTDFLEKATWSLAGFIVVLSVVITLFIPRHSAGVPDSEIKEDIQNAVTVDPNVAPPFSTSPAPAPGATEGTPAQEPAPQPAE